MTETQPRRAVAQDGRDFGPADGPPRRRRRRARRWSLVVALLLIAGAAAAWLLTGDRGAVAAEPYLTEAARTADLQDRVEASATVAWPQEATAELRAPAAGTVTAVAVREGDRPGQLSTVVEVSDSPLVALASPVPLYRDLTEDLEGPDVQALEQALLAVGQDPGADDAVFDESTTAAVEAWESANGLEETGQLPLSRALWLPPGAQVTAVQVRPGDPVAPGTPLVAVAQPDGLVVNAALDQADVGRVAAGAVVEVELDALDAPLTGSVEAVALTPEDGTYRATVRLTELPPTVRSGMEGTARVLVGVRQGAVVVPSGAVSTSAAQPTVRVLVGGRPEVRVVELGLVTTDGAEILSGVAAGDAIVVGERD